MLRAGSSKCLELFEAAGYRPPVIYQHPLAYLLGLEGVATLQSALKPGKSIGIRGVQMEAIEIFDAEMWLLVWWGAIVCEWYGGSAVQGGGIAKGIGIRADGTAGSVVYDDTVTKRDGAWRITARTITVRRKPFGRD